MNSQRSSFTSFANVFSPFRADCLPARVVAAHKDRLEVKIWDEATNAFTEETRSVELSGRFRREAKTPSSYPVLGDWIAIQGSGEGPARIVAVLPRFGLLSRKRPGDVDYDALVEQPIAANIDIALLLMALDNDFSTNRLARYLAVAWDAGAEPVVVLTKADLAGTGGLPALEERVKAAEDAAFGVKVISSSIKNGQGLERLKQILIPGSTAIALGSSGIGKSSLLNALAGISLSRVQEVRAFDGKGRHTTTVRRMFTLPWGAYLVDTPGLRELQLWGDEAMVDAAFPDIEELGANCRFRDCTHHNEPACAVRAALEDGRLTGERFAAWQKMNREIAYLNKKADLGAERAEKARWKGIAQLQKEIKNKRR